MEPWEQVFTAAEEETISGKDTKEVTIHGKSHSNENWNSENSINNSKTSCHWQNILTLGLEKGHSLSI